jgi:glycosidase
MRRETPAPATMTYSRQMGATRAMRPAPRYLGPHLTEPDYARPLLQVSPAHRDAIVRHLTTLYGPVRANSAYVEIERLMRVYYAHKTPEMIEADRGFDPGERFTEQDVILITYGDLLVQQGKRPLEALHDFLSVYMQGAINTVHILPFFPSSSDRGFAIVDYEDVDPRLGTWEDIDELTEHFKLMFDGVFNHASSKSKMFQRFLSGHPGYDDLFIAFSTRDAIHPDYLRLILRPRTSSLLTPFRTINGTRYVWTTFSPDQVDLNFKSERVLQDVVEILLYYVRRGADLIRLDAVTYIWRELGTTCAHLEQTHALVKLFRAILDVVAPQVALITETNVPHADNVGYFGDGRDEAQMIYNFALPPLVLHAFHRADTTVLTRWAAGLDLISPTATYFNFLASHDGVGLLGARGILAPEEMDMLVDKCREHGGLVSYRDNGDGTTSPYELNTTWWSAVNNEAAGEPLALQIDRFVATRSIPLVLRGVPGVYLPSLFGAKNDTQTALASRDNRSINRTTIQVEPLVELLSDRRSWVRLVATRIRRMLKRRVARPAFHPNADQLVIDAGASVFAILRTAATRANGAPADRVLAITSVSAAPVELAIDLAAIGVDEIRWRDTLSRRPLIAIYGQLLLTLRPYEVLWLVPEPTVREAGPADEEGVIEL